MKLDDSVQLKTGGPEMKIKFINTNGEDLEKQSDIVYCIWNDEFTGSLHGGAFDIKLLKYFEPKI